MKNYLKFLQRLPKPLRLKLIGIIERIALNDLKDLDIKLLTEKSHFYRCRVGKIRIIFIKDEQECIIYDVGFRGDVYKNL